MWVDSTKPELQESLKSEAMPALAGIPYSPTFGSGIISMLISGYE